MINDQSRWIRNVQTRRLHPSHVLVYSFELEKNMESVNVHVYMLGGTWSGLNENSPAGASGNRGWPAPLSDGKANFGRTLLLPLATGLPSPLMLVSGEQMAATSRGKVACV